MIKYMVKAYELGQNEENNVLLTGFILIPYGTVEKDLKNKKILWYGMLLVLYRGIGIFLNCDSHTGLIWHSNELMNLLQYYRT